MSKNNEEYHILSKYTLKKCPQDIVPFVINTYVQIFARRLKCHLEVINHQRRKSNHTVLCFVAPNREVFFRHGRLFECTTPWFGELSRCALLVLRQGIVKERLREQSVSFCRSVNRIIYALYSRQGSCGEKSNRYNKLALFSTEGFYKFKYSKISDSASTNLNNCLYKIQSEENLRTLAKEQDLLCLGQLKDIANGSRQIAADDAKTSENERKLSEHLLRERCKLVDGHSDRQQTHCSSIPVYYFGGFLHNTTGHNVASPMDKKHYEQLIYRPLTKPSMPNVNLDVCQRHGARDKMETKSDTQPSLSAKSLKLIRGLTTSKDVSLIPEEFPSITCSCKMAELSDHGGMSVGDPGQKRSRSASIRRPLDELNRSSNAVRDTPAAKPQQSSAERNVEIRNREVLGGQPGLRLVHDPHPCNNQRTEFSPLSHDATDKHTCVTSIESSPLNSAVKRPEEPVMGSRLKTPPAQQNQQQRRLQLTQHPITMCPQSPKRLIRMNEVKRGKACEYSVGRTFTGARAGRDVTTQFIATCTDGPELESEIQPWAGRGEGKMISLSAQISPRPQWTNSTDLYSAPLCEQGTQNATRHTMAARPTVQQVVNLGMPYVRVGCVPSITSQVLPTYRVRSCGVQASVTHARREEQCQTLRDITGGCSPASDIDMLKFDPKKHFVHSPNPTSSGRMTNLITQIAREKKTPGKRKKGQLSTKFVSAKSYAERPVTHSPPEVTTVPYEGYINAILCGSVMRTQIPVDDMDVNSGRRNAISTPNSVSSGDELEVSTKMGIIPAYVQRTESWSYWPRTVIYPPVSKASISSAWNPVNSGLDGTGNIDLKSGRVRRSSDLLRSCVFASGESKYITSSDSDRDLHEPPYSTTPHNKEPAEDLDAPHSHSSLSESFSAYRKSLISTWSTDSTKLRICAVQRRADLYRPTCVGESLHRASVIVNSQKAVKPELVQAHKVVDIRIDPNPMLPDIPHTYSPSKSSVDSNECILKHAAYNFSKHSERRCSDASAQTKPTPGGCFNFVPGVIQVSEIHANKFQDQTLPFPRRFPPPQPPHPPSYLTKNLSWDHISTGGNPPIQPVVPLRCRRSESPNHAPGRKSVDRSRSGKGRVKSGSSSLSLMNRMFVFSHPEPPSIMSLSIDNQTQETTLNKGVSPAASTSSTRPKFIRRGRSKSHSIPVGLRTQTRSAVRMSAWNAQPHSARRSNSVIGDLYSYAFRTDIRREHHTSLTKAHFQELRKLVEAYFSGHRSGRSSLESIRTTNMTRTSAPGGPMDHICSRYFRTFTNRPKSCEMRQTAAQAWTTTSSASREYSGLARRSSGNGGSVNERSTWSAEIPDYVPISISSKANALGCVPTQAQHQDMLRTATEQSPVSDVKYILESSCKDNSVCTTCASSGKNQVDQSGFEETASSEIKAVDQRIGEALHGTLERILFESVDKLSSLTQTSHTERPIKLVSKLEFVEDHTEDGVDVRKGPSVIRSYEFVHTEPGSTPDEGESKIFFVDKKPMVIGTDKTDEVEDFWRKASNSGLERSLWCCTLWRKSLSTSSK